MKGLIVLVSALYVNELKENTVIRQLIGESLTKKRAKALYR
jgi:hypothetical protein